MNEGLPSQYYFLHIPKTAGCTFNNSILPQLFRNEEIRPAWCCTELLKIRKEDLRGYRVFRGHFYSFLSCYSGLEPRTMTFLSRSRRANSSWCPA